MHDAGALGTIDIAGFLQLAITTSTDKMASPQFRRNATAAALLFLAAWGAYATYGLGAQNGLFDTIHASLDVENPYVPGGVSPLRTRYVASPVIDKHITVLISFFSYAIDPPHTKDVDVTSLVVMAHFCAGWALIRFEGWRLGNKQKLIAWWVFECSPLGVQ